ncbi:TSHSV-HP1 [Trionyx sinensis hemorrhagic syndrome virus]|uniref:TSHSV-HP1 n=1 Tax=Trionyx sinensis hemorrhagic syndrome virus TaxID=1705352 RepID=A0AAE7J0E6_9NIDO|nr:TSHSV-HP1 [Trionyx sinensis hemorrhagic syndrome virus]QNI38732.1 TSHSV-HP1 [Trionyx sinensis hemorrhagic syndrome virus]
MVFAFAPLTFSVLQNSLIFFSKVLALVLWATLFTQSSPAAQVILGILLLIVFCLLFIKLDDRSEELTYPASKTPDIFV